MKLAHEIVGLYKEVYYACRCAGADRTTNNVATQRSLAVEREAREKLAVNLASQQVSWAAKWEALLRDMIVVV